MTQFLKYSLVTGVMLTAMLLGGAPSMASTSDLSDEQQQLLEKLNNRWDDKVGLWFGSTKYGREGHDIRASAGKLVQAANAGILHRVQYERVLATIRKTQAGKGEKRWGQDVRGNFWWAWEAKKVTDMNSGFFTTVQLLALHHEHREKLSDKAKADLDHMLSEARFWFESKVYPIKEDKVRYPNAYFGDAMCLWLLTELQGEVPEKLKKDFHTIIRYYLEQDWGWGEHLSDMYSKILQRELVALLMWQKRLTPEMEKDVRQMMTELCQIDAWYEGGPAVPAVRNYWIEKTPGTTEKRTAWFRPYIELMRSETVGEFGIASLGYKHGLHEDFQMPPRTSPEVTVDTYAGRKAYAWVEDRWRLGVQSWYPFFPDMATHKGYGMPWHAMPVAFWHRDGDWVYLQWATEEGGKVHAHPAMDKKQAQKEKLCALSNRDKNATAANTRGLREGKQFLVVRDLPRTARSWAWAADRLRVVAGTHGEPVTDQINGWHRLVLAYEKETLTVCWRPIVGSPEHASETVDGQLFWGPRIDLKKNPNHGQMINLWYLTVDEKPATPPAVAGEGKKLKVTLTSGQAFDLDASKDDPWGIHGKVGKPGSWKP